MKVLGLTGPSGAGKGFVCALFARHGIPSIDADRVYHDLLVPPSQCLDALVERFGRSVLFPDGTLDRKARILQRDSIPEEAAERRLSAQPDDAFYTARAHFVLHNEGDEKALEAQLAPILADVAEGAAV